MARVDTAHMGCIKGCMDYMGIEASVPWIYGATAHAFVLNIRETVCVSSPYAWDKRMIFDLGRNLGLASQWIVVPKRETPDDVFAQKQRQVWDLVRECIDRGNPCYGYEIYLPIPDYYVIPAYDEVGYYYDGCVTGGPTPWEKLGTHDVMVLEVCLLEPCEPSPPDKTVRDALSMALKFNRDPGDMVFPTYASGEEAFDLWATELEQGRALRDHHSWNAFLWRDCRRRAVEFLREAKARLPGRCDAAFDEAIAHYSVARDRLEAVADLHPERDKADWTSPLQSDDAAALIREAGEAESRGMDALERVVAALA
jgi:hypothetical protein